MQNVQEKRLLLVNYTIEIFYISLYNNIIQYKKER